MTETIILSAGKIKYLHLPISGNTSNAMVPINGKPAIGWILDDLIKKNISEVKIVVMANDFKLISYLSAVYQNSIKIELIPVGGSNSILESLQTGLLTCQGKDGIRILLGDTLILDSMELDSDYIYISQVSAPHKWCIALMNIENKVLEYKDKSYFTAETYHAVCGFYAFLDGDYLKKALADCLQQEKTQISDLLSKYQEKYLIKVKETFSWFDFGNVDNLIKSRQLLLQSRYFNSLKVDPVLNTITKTSDFDDKLRNELLWFDNLPSELQVLCPRILSRKVIDGKLQLKQEYYGYPTLAELYLFSDLGVDEWESIIFRLVELHSEFEKYVSEMPFESFDEIYRVKTWERVDKMVQFSPEWHNLIEGLEHIVINGTSFKTVGMLKPWIHQRILKITETSKSTIIHGDFCFSNILFDLNGHIARLIDPRGSFGEVGIYGDARYDMAKFLHSLHGGYDFIVTDQFCLNELDKKVFEFEVTQNPYKEVLTKIFLDKLEENGFDTSDIYFIEGLLFLSMLPLHKDKPKRQLAMYLTSLKIFNEIYENRN
jgi:dTDP-glucose pyrophosphorylase